MVSNYLVDISEFFLLFGGVLCCSEKVFVSQERVSGFPEKGADLRGSPGNFWGSPGNFLVSPDFLPPASCDLPHARKGKRPFQRKTLEKGSFPFLAWEKSHLAADRKFGAH